MNTFLRRDQVFTHRGLEASNPNYPYPESSYEAFTDQLSRGFGIEFDPNFVSDGIIVSHDSNLKRITNGTDQRDFHNVTMTEIIPLKYQTKNASGSSTSEGRIPTLKEVLDLIAISPSKINALHLKGKFQDQNYLDRLLAELSQYPQLLDRIVIFDAKPETAKYLREELRKIVQDKQIHIAPSVALEYDMERYNSAVLGTLIGIDDAINLFGIYDWVWLDEWDRTNKDGSDKTLYNAEVFSQLKQAGYKIALVTPELHGTSPGLLGGEAHQDAKDQETLFKRIEEIITLQPDAICTDYPETFVQPL